MTPECALTKLAYLLSKSDRLSANEIRQLICVPLRGELALPTNGDADHSSSNWSLVETKESLPNILHNIARLSAPPPSLPNILVSPVKPSGTSLGGRSTTPPHALPKGPPLSSLAKEATSPWSNTISETASTEAALLPFLVHLAVARDDADALRFCFSTSSTNDANATPMGEPSQPLFSSGVVEAPQAFNSSRGVAGGIVNVVDPASGRTPLHVAALNGSKKCAMLLLESGALVHLRDTLDHTALYYAARQGYETVVNDLVQAGAHLGGSDFAFMRVAVRKAQHLGDHSALRVWRRVGVEFNETVNLIGPSTSP